MLPIPPPHLTLLLYFHPLQEYRERSDGEGKGRRGEGEKFNIISPGVVSGVLGGYEVLLGGTNTSEVA